MADKNNYRVESEWGVLSSRENKRTGEITEIRLTKTSWFGKPAKWDLRNWTEKFAGNGVVIGNDASLRKLRDMLIDICKQNDEDDDDED